MPLEAAHTASVEDRMRSERNKGSAENLYSTGFVAPAFYRLSRDRALSLPWGRLALGARGGSLQFKTHASG
jgi:hypothetical protein